MLSQGGRPNTTGQSHNKRSNTYASKRIVREQKILVSIIFFVHSFHEAMFTNIRNMNQVMVYFTLIIKCCEAKANI